MFCFCLCFPNGKASTLFSTKPFTTFVFFWFSDISQNKRYFCLRETCKLTEFIQRPRKLIENHLLIHLGIRLSRKVITRRLERLRKNEKKSTFCLRRFLAKGITWVWWKRQTFTSYQLCDLTFLNLNVCFLNFPDEENNSCLKGEY